MAYRIRIISTYPPEHCGIGIFTRNLINAIGKDFVSEVSSMRVAAIDASGLHYNFPANDLVIDKYNPKSWGRTASLINSETFETEEDYVLIMQYEFGLDPDEKRNDGRGNNFVEVSKKFNQNKKFHFDKEPISIAYLHTVLRNPNNHQREALQDLAKYNDGIIVTTNGAIKTLTSDTYGIDNQKIKHISHGVRFQNPSELERLEKKKKYGLEDIFLITSLGFISDSKRLDLNIRAHAAFLNMCTPKQREKILYLIAGQYHPGFVKANGGKNYREYKNLLEKIIKDSGLKFRETEKLEDIKSEKVENLDVLFVSTFLKEEQLLGISCAEDVGILNYKDKEQISSGVFSDKLGTGRVAICSDFDYAKEMIRSPTGSANKRPFIGDCGILVDTGKKSVDQITNALYYLLTHPNERFSMEVRAHEKGRGMRWHEASRSLLDYLGLIKAVRKRSVGREEVINGDI